LLIVAIGKLSLSMSARTSRVTRPRFCGLASGLVGPIGVGVDRSTDRKTWVIAAAQRTVEGKIHLEVGPYQYLSSSAEVVDKCADIVIEWDPNEVAIDQRSPAAVIKPSLEALGIEPKMTNTTELVLACGAFLDAVDAGQLSHSDQTALNDGAVSAVKRDLAAGFAWDKAPGVTYLAAASLAAWSLISATTVAPKRSLPPMAEKDYDERNEPVFLDMDKVKF
jgi:hypothetical protein